MTRGLRHKNSIFRVFLLLSVAVTIFFGRKTWFLRHSPTSFRSPKLEEAGIQIEGSRSLPKTHNARFDRNSLRYRYLLLPLSWVVKPDFWFRLGLCQQPNQWDFLNRQMCRGLTLNYLGN